MFLIIAFDLSFIVASDSPVSADKTFINAAPFSVGSSLEKSERLKITLPFISSTALLVKVIANIFR